jgi:SAM-dependent methyltransferase
MGLYSRMIFPRICDCLMGNPVMNGYRKELLAGVGGDVLEIGFGTGLNLPHYPEHVRKITTVEPSAGMNQMALRRITQSGITVDQRALGGEELPFENDTFDSIVSTWTLCSIPEVERAMGEVYRVLKPGGRFIFLEHGLSDIPKVQRWQRRLNWLQRLLAEGCRLNLNVEAVVKGQPFRNVEMDRFVMDRAPRTHGTMYRGFATK